MENRGGVLPLSMTFLKLETVFLFVFSLYLLHYVEIEQCS
jgi:hypothetical protein